jgi:Uma2 family endonuclease
MSLGPRPSPRRTLDEWLAQPSDARLELIDGEFIEKALPSVEHANAQGAAIQALRGAFHRRGGGGHGRSGGWWILPEVDLVLGEHGFRPDLAGWRRDRVPELPIGRPLSVRPDWLCEVLSASNAGTDTITKMYRYHQAGVPHYWVIDPTAQTLGVWRNTPEGYLNVLMATRSETVRAEPFEAFELRVGLFFGDEPDD